MRMEPSVGYERFLAVRLLLRAHRQKFIPLVAWLSMGGVALGVASLIIVLSVMAGFEDDMRQKITAMSAHVWIQPLTGTPGGIGPLLKAVRGTPGVEAAGRYLPRQALIQSRGATTGVVLFGLDSDAAGEVVRLKAHLKSGKLPDFGGNGAEIMLGAELAQQLGAFTGDRVVLVTADRLNAPVPRMLSVVVSGVYEVGMYEYDAHTAYLPLNGLLRLAPNANTQGVMVRTKDLFTSSETAVELQVAAGPQWIARDWMVLNRNLFFAIRVERFVMFIILLTIVTVAAFNITSSLIMTVMEKTRAIGIMGALGMPARRLGRIFVVQGALVGSAGILAGMVAGLAVCAIISVYPIKMPGGGSVYYLTYLPVQVNWLVSLVFVPGAAFLLCILSALYPARQASRLDPVEAIRYE